MTDQPQTPSPSMDALLNRLDQLLHFHPVDGIKDELWALIGDVDSEARAEAAQAGINAVTNQAGQIAALRSALERLRNYGHAEGKHGGVPSYCTEWACLEANRVRNLSPSAATEYEARIRAEAVKPWREALQALYDAEKTGVVNLSTGDYDRISAARKKARALLSQMERGG